MEKGCSCIPSKKKIFKSTSLNPPPSQRDSLLSAYTQNLKLFIIFYSMYGHVESLVPETLSEEVLVQMQELADADGFLFGFPMRYGCMTAQMKLFFYSTRQL
uniref:NAD(P)H dehydrogenase (quinone) n=1 Tax=Solanum lycopersicum TaxID=4081 RepID=A0A3Q7EYT0_SOLLC